MFESSNSAFLLAGLSFGFASFVYIFYGPKQTSKSTKTSKFKSIIHLFIHLFIE